VEPDGPLRGVRLEVRNGSAEPHLPVFADGCVVSEDRCRQMRVQRGARVI
jgi:hypothetical protein